jgi:hypothetical protein
MYLDYILNVPQIHERRKGGKEETRKEGKEKEERNAVLRF